MKFVVVQGREIATGAVKRFNVNIEQVAYIEQVSVSEFNINTSGGLFKTNLAGVNVIINAAKGSIGLLDSSSFLDSVEDKAY